jgi:Icc-related predicted phosphoesterase
MSIVQLASDLHEDVNKDGSLEPVGDLLLLLGDVSDYPHHWDAYKYLPIQTLGIMGNHEFMHKEGSVESRVAEYKDRFKDTNLHLLHNEFVTIRGINYIGTTLWSDISTIENSPRSNMETLCAGGVTIDEWIEEHRLAVEFLENALTALGPDSVNVIMSHFSPSFKGVDDKFKDEPGNIFYHTDLEWLMRKYKPLLWMHGHTHTPVDYYVGSTRVLSNPKGKRKYNEGTAFNESFTLDLNN